MNDTATLPSGWTLGRLLDLIGRDGFITDGDWVESKDQDPNGKVRLTQLADIGDGEFRDRSQRFLTPDSAHRLGCTHLQPGDLLIARMPDPLGRCCVFPELHRDCVTAVDVCIARLGASPVSNRWLMHTINSPVVRASVSGLQSGSTRKRISKRNLLTIELPVPPAAEQFRIADAIETQLTRLDAAVAALERVRANLKRYWASVLKAAVEGRLVPTEAELARQEGRDYEPASVLLKRILAERRRRWEEAELADMKAKGKAPKDDKWKATYKEPVAPDTTGLPELPEGWCWAGLDQLSSGIRNGYSKAPNESSGVRVLRICAVRSMEVNLDDVRFLPPPINEYETYRVEDGDLLFTRYNGSPDLVGVCGLVRHLKEATVYPDKLIRVRTFPGLVLSSFIEVAANSGRSRRHIEQQTRTTAGQAGISGADLKKMPVPLPPNAEQVRVVAEVERLCSVAGASERIANVVSLRTDRLRQSILKCAFEGKLVDQDPNDEPAFVLLERIRVERGAVTANGKGKIKRNGRKRKAA